MTVNPLLTPYLNFTHPENAPKLNQRSSFTPTPYPSRKGQLYHIYILLYIYTYNIYNIYFAFKHTQWQKLYSEYKQGGRKCQQIRFSNNKMALPIMSHPGQKTAIVPHPTYKASLCLGPTLGGFQSLEPCFSFATWPLAALQRLHTLARTVCFPLPPHPNPLCYTFLLCDFAHVLPSSEGKKHLSYFSPLQILLICQSPLKSPKTLCQTRRPTAISPPWQLYIPTGLTNHTSPVFNFLKISIFATFYLNVKDSWILVFFHVPHKTWLMHSSGLKRKNMSSYLFRADNRYTELNLPSDSKEI